MNIQNKTMFLKTHKTLLWLSLFLILGILIRIYKLGDHNLWFDEFMTLRYVREFSFIERDYNPYLYYIALSFWIRWFGPVIARFSGSSEFILRSLSMIFGVIAIPLIYKLGKLFFDTRTGLISAFILSISPIHIWYSQEARVYSLSVFLTMFTVYIFFMALQKNKLYFWVVFVTSSLLALLTNYLSFFIIILVGISFVFRTYRPSFKSYLVSLCFIFSASLPFLPLLFKQTIMLRNSFWIPKPHLRNIAITFENFNVGYNATPNIYFFTFIIFSLLFILGIKCWWKEKRKELILLILFIFIPIISTFLISQKILIYLDRQLMLFSPFYYIIIAAGLARIKLPMIKTSAYLSISLPILFCLYNYFSYHMPLPQYHHTGVHVKKAVKPAAEYIIERFIEGDAIGISGPSSTSLFFYTQKFINKKAYVFSFVIPSKLDKYWKGVREKGAYIGMHSSNVRMVILDEEKSYETIEDYNFKRLWLISSSWARDGILDLHAQAVREWMRSNYSILDSKEFDGIFIDLYYPKVNSGIK